VEKLELPVLTNLKARSHSFIQLINTSLLLLILNTIILQAQWMQTNGPEGGDVRTIVWDDSRIYTGLYGGGIHISSNNGASWTRSNNGLPVPLLVQTMLVKDQYVFAGLLNWKVYVSSNQGQTWDEANSGLPNATINILAETDSFIFAGFTNGLYRSSNYGANWTYSGNGLNNSYIKSFTVKDSIIIIGTEDGVFISTNYGENWVEKSNGLVDRYINDLNVLKNYISAATREGVYISSDNGDNWVPAGLSGLHILSLTSVDTILFAGVFSSGVYYSSDYGLNWFQFNDGFPPNVNTRTLETKDDQIFAGNDLGIYSVKLSNPVWIDMNSGLYGTTSYSFAVKDSVLVAGTNSGGVFISFDNGENWISRRIVNGYNGPVALEFKGDSLYALCFSGGLFVSANLGLNWNELYIPTQYFTSMAIRGNNIFVGTDQTGFWVSTNSGSSWSQMNSGLTNLFVKAIAVDDSNVYVGTNEGLFISSDNGKNWALAGPGISQTISVRTIKIIDNSIYVGAIYGIYLSTNRGANWSYKGFGNDIVECIEGYGDVVFAGIPDPRDGGIFFSTNEGGTWQQFNSGLPYLDPQALAIVDTTLFAGIYGHSVWRTSGIVTEISDRIIEIPNDYVLLQNYPNPFNPTTIIKYQIPEPSFVTIRVYDILGNEIATLVYEEKQTGSYGVSFDATGLPSGIYFFRLQASKSGINSSQTIVETKKMVYLK